MVQLGYGIAVYNTRIHSKWMPPQTQDFAITHSITRKSDSFFSPNRVIRGFQETEVHKVNVENQALWAWRGL